MIVTLTANPALDRTVELSAALRPGEVQAAAAAREDAGGKGVNVARVVAVSAVAALAVLPAAPEDPYTAALALTGVPTRTVAVTRRARANLTITDPDGVTTKVNLPGAPLSADDVAALTSAVVEASGGASWLVLAGSLPAGLPEDYYVQVIDAVRARWGTQAPRIAVDTSGAALRATVERGAPDLIKPNDEELAELVDADVLPTDPEAVAAVARRIVPTRAGAALVTLGGSGAVLVTADGAWFATAPRIRVASTVGAGDSSLAGFLLADQAGAAPEQRLLSAIRYGAAAAALPGTQPPAPEDLPADELVVRAL